MGIGKIEAAGGVSGAEMTRMQPVDTVSKNIENEIFGLQRRMKELSSNEELSAEEKGKKRQEFRQEISKLNIELRQHQAELGREKRGEVIRREIKEDGGEGRDAKAGNGAAGSTKADGSAADSAGAAAGKVPDRASMETKAAGSEASVQALAAGSAAAVQTKSAGSSVVSGEGPGSGEDNDIRADAAGDRDAEKTEEKRNFAKDREMFAGDSAMKRAKSQGAVIARMEGGIAILKGEIKQDEARGVNVDRKKEELARQERKLEQASAFQSSILGGSNQTLQEAARSQTGGGEGSARAGSVQAAGLINR